MRERESLRAAALCAVVFSLAACGPARSRSHAEPAVPDDAGPGSLADGGRRGPVPIAPDAFVAPDDDAGWTVTPPPADASGPTPMPDAAAPPRDPSCTYPPGATGSMTMGAVIAPYRWSAAYDAEGARTDLDLERFHCDPAYDAYRSILFVVGTGWCPNCPEYLAWVAGLGLEARGTLVVFLESENADYAVASSEDARATVDRAIGRGRGLRVGEASNATPNAIGRQTHSVPSGYFVRRSDMRILAGEEELGTTPPWDEMAAAPEMDWLSILRGGGSGTPCTEETNEPNDSSAAAAAIAPGTLRGGICGADDDWFRVSVAGAWRVDLAFRHRDGDLDLFVTDASGRVLTSSEGAADGESVSGTGPAYLRVIGYGGARAPYTLTLVSP